MEKSLRVLLSKSAAKSLLILHLPEAIPDDIYIPKEIDTIKLSSETFINETQTESPVAEIANKEFECVLILNCLQSVNYRKLFAAIRPILAKNGMLLVLEPVLRTETPQESADVWTVRRLEAKMQKYGFDIQEEVIYPAVKSGLVKCLLSCQIAPGFTVSSFDSTDRIVDEQGFRLRSAGICVRKVEPEDYEVLLLKRRSIPGPDGCWTIPGGGLEENEEPKVAVSREVYEEIGVQGEVLADVDVLCDQEGKKKTYYFLFEVKKVLTEYPENNRIRSWFQISKNGVMCEGLREKLSNPVHFELISKAFNCLSSS